MRALITVLLIFLTSFVAVAGENPSVRLYVSFDPYGYVSSIEPVPYSIYNAYVWVDCLGDEFSAGGISSLFFRVDLTGGASPYANFTPMVPIALPITWPELDGDIPMVMLECLQQDPCPLLQIQLFWLGEPGCVLVGDHNEWPRNVVDCNGEMDYYCVYAHGSVAGGSCPSGDTDCDCPGGTPVESSSWGRVKALYQQWPSN